VVILGALWRFGSEVDVAFVFSLSKLLGNTDQYMDIDKGLVSSLGVLGPCLYNPSFLLSLMQSLRRDWIGVEASSSLHCSHKLYYIKEKIKEGCILIVLEQSPGI
jgi:hypothetical protein